MICRFIKNNLIFIMADNYMQLRPLSGLTGQCLDTTANWITINPILPLGVFGIERTVSSAYKLKVGDGTSNWNSLPYLTSSGSGGSASPPISEEGIVAANTTLITTTQAYDIVAKNIHVYLGGVKQRQSSLTFVDSHHLHIGIAFSVVTEYEVIIFV